MPANRQLDLFEGLLLPQQPAPHKTRRGDASEREQAGLRQSGAGHTAPASPLAHMPPLGSPAPTPPAPPIAPLHPMQRGAPAPDDAAPTPRPATLPPDTRWREVRARAQIIGFVLRRSRRKSIGLVVDDGGLQVTAPNWVTLGQIDAAVLEKERWILAKLRQRHSRMEHLATADTQWLDGGSLPYFGTRIVLRLDGARRTPDFSGSPFMPARDDSLTLPLPAEAGQARVRDSTHAWLQHQARLWFDRRLQHFLDSNGLAMRKWRLSSAATRWGSCSSDGNIMLNWRLIHFSHDIIDYVIAHEVAHLRHLNHSPAFWREVGLILPGFEKSRDALRQHRPGSLPLI